MLAEWQFDYWGPLTGFDTIEQYVAALEQWSVGEGIPAVIVAANGSQILGSVNLLRSDMKSRLQLMPWLAQLFVVPQHRQVGVGAALVKAAIERTRKCGFAALYLYTSGTLPQYYARLGWEELERVRYLGKERTVMRYDVG